MNRYEIMSIIKSQFMQLFASLLAADNSTSYSIYYKNILDKMKSSINLLDLSDVNLSTIETFS